MHIKKTFSMWAWRSKQWSLNTCYAMAKNENGLERALNWRLSTLEQKCCRSSMYIKTQLREGIGQAEQCYSWTGREHGVCRCWLAACQLGSGSHVVIVTVKKNNTADERKRKMLGARRPISTVSDLNRVRGGRALWVTRLIHRAGLSAPKGQEGNDMSLALRRRL